ncbi:beta-galactosidase [Paenibacillus mucilaginosus]|uniref:glycoside hydrolase family 2 TIM barrel-domain containing protein n=1 Tax=Paenibacillus mucilaginosus TaxID=61624 RepID=UPI003D1C654E
MNFADEDNVIAVKNDNRVVTEAASGVAFQWQGRGFNPVYGGLTRNINLYVMDPVYFTLPLYSNLKTYGTYIYPSEISTDRRTAVVNVESQVKNDSGRSRTMKLEAVVVNKEGHAVRTVASEPHTIPTGEDYTFKAAGAMTDVHFWQPDYPYLYQVYCILKEDGRAVDVYPITTGFRKAEFKGGYNTGGVYINNKQIYLTGYAQRSTNEWAVLGNAVPEWVTDFDGNLIRESNANFIRSMHISAEPADIRMTDKYGIVSLQPAGDSEQDVTGRQWEQRVETMRDSIIYFRNSPSILFWEAGNNTITAEHMKEMRELKERLDPNGMRAVGSRGLRDPAAVDHAEFVGTMLNRHYTDYARDKVPIVESEISGAANYYEYYKDRIQGPETSNDMYSAAAALIWADSNQHGRNYLTENSRMSGRVDAVRIPKESFYAFRVMQNANPDLHLVGHWSYPAGTGNVAAEMTKETTGAAAAIKLTPITGPQGLQADGEDAAIFDVEVVDAEGRRLPTDQARVDFELTGPGEAFGGSGIDPFIHSAVLVICAALRAAWQQTRTYV